MTKDDHAYQIAHQCVVFLDIFAEQSGAVVFVCDLFDSLRQSRILCLSSHVVNREWKALLNVTPGARCIPRPVATGRVSCVCDWLRDTTDLDFGDRSWICNAALVFRFMSLLISLNVLS